MDFATALLYGVIQGLSEFLPVSSSGHLALLPFFMEFKDPGVLFDLCMHLGTALAVLLYYRTRVAELARAAGPGILDLSRQEPARVFLRNFVCATAVSVAVILVLKPFADLGRSPWAIMVNQALFGILLWVADRAQRKHGEAEGTAEFFGRAHHWRVAAVIGAAQALAIFPGVSRSGVTLTAAFLLGLGRTQAGHFSFLLSLPIILAGMLVELPTLPEELARGGVEPSVLVAGVATSFAVGFATIHYFLKLIARISLGWFTLYRLVLAGVLAGLLLS